MPPAHYSSILLTLGQRLGCSRIAAAISGSLHPRRHRQAPLARESGLKEHALVTLAAICQDGDDGLARAEIACAATPVPLLATTIFPPKIRN
jgi:hypothetical protein